MVVRGCVSELLPEEVSLCEAGQSCKICQGDNCNEKISFQSCWACDATTNPGCFLAQTGTDTKKTCSDYMDECATFTDKGITYRGCKKELPIPEVCTSCLYCTGNDCNYGVATVPSELHCHVCDSAVDADCDADKSTGVATLCDYKMVIGREDQCYTFQTGNRFMRGCLYNSVFDVQFKCMMGEPECNACGTNGCNSAKLEAPSVCYSCDGTDDPNCATLTGLVAKECPKGEKSGCFRSQVGKLFGNYRIT